MFLPPQPLTSSPAHPHTSYSIHKSCQCCHFSSYSPIATPQPPAAPLTHTASAFCLTFRQFILYTAGRQGDLKRPSGHVAPLLVDLRRFPTAFRIRPNSWAGIRGFHDLAMLVFLVSLLVLPISPLPASCVSLAVSHPCAFCLD